MSDILEKAAASGTVLSPLESPGAMTAEGNSNDNGGVLNPEQSRQFIDYIWDEMVLANDGRRVVMRANTMELDKVRVGSRLVAKATQAEDTGSNSAPAFTKIELTTTKFRLDYEISTESLEDNIEGDQLGFAVSRSNIAAVLPLNVGFQHTYGADVILADGQHFQMSSTTWLVVLLAKIPTRRRALTKSARLMVSL